MKSNTKNILILTIAFLVLAILLLITILADKIPENPPDTVGNTAGNLNNNGLFCEDEGTVYFSNAYDNNTLYSMNADESGVKRISNAKVSSLNAAGKYLYYYQEDSAASSNFASLFRINGIYRSKKNGKSAVCLKRSPSPCLVLTGNTIFYQLYNTKTGTALYRIGIDKKNDMMIEDYVINPASVQNGVIYFGGTQKNHYLYTLDTATNSISTVWDGNVYNPIVQDDYVYYMDISSNYRLCRYSLSSQSVDVLTEDRLDFFNVYGSIIYYQKSDPEEPALKRISIDGSNEEVVLEGVYENINITSQYVYFNAYQAQTPVLHTPTTGPVSVTEFEAAEAAALKNQK